MRMHRLILHKVYWKVVSDILSHTIDLKFMTQRDSDIICLHIVVYGSDKSFNDKADNVSSEASNNYESSDKQLKIRLSDGKDILMVRQYKSVQILNPYKKILIPSVEWFVMVWKGSWRYRGFAGLKVYPKKPYYRWWSQWKQLWIKANLEVYKCLFA